MFALLYIGSDHSRCELRYSGHVPCVPSNILLQSCVKDSTTQLCVIHGVCMSSLSYWVQHGPFSFHLYSRRTTNTVHVGPKTVIGVCNIIVKS